VRGTALMMSAQGVRLAFQAAYFVVIARALGVERFGALAAALALVAILVPFAAWGMGNVLVMAVARDRGTYASALGDALLAIALSSCVLVPLAVGAGALLLPAVPSFAILLLALADLAFARVVDVASQCYQAFDRLAAMAILSVLVPGLRFLAVSVFAATSSSRGLATWAAFYLGGTVIAAAAGLRNVWRRLGAPAREPGLRRRGLKLGGYFAVSAMASTVYGDIDKAMLGRLSTLGATGIYAAADRAVGMVFMPVMALLTAAYASFFRAGTTGIAGSRAFARRLLPAAAAYGAVAGLAVYFLAPLARYVLGAGFSGTTGALRWLAAVPLLSALYYLPADALTGAGAQGVRTALQLFAAALNVGLNLVLIPAYSWRGAAWSTLATLAFLCASLWIAAAQMERGAKTDSLTSTR
jgi:O-antigen/teichoic acid export membrane protein